MSDIINDIVTEIADERLNQEEEWGQQDHPSSYDLNSVREAKRHADRYKAVNAARVAEGKLTWDGILLEEVYEALAETSNERRRAELVQVAAVCAAEIEAIDRRIDNRPALAAVPPVDLDAEPDAD